MREGEFVGARRHDRGHAGAKGDQAVTCQCCARQQGPTHRNDHARHGLPPTAQLYARRLPPPCESTDHIPNRSRRVRVQTVNAIPGAKKCRVKLYPRDFYANGSVSRRELAPGRTEAAAAGTSSAWTTDAITSCAIRSPRRIGNGASP